MDTTKLQDIILAILFASDEPLPAKKIASLLDDTPLSEVKSAIASLAEKLERDVPSIGLERLAGGYQLSTKPAFGEYVARLYTKRRKQRLTRASMETLAIIAYKQPITRADIENLRGVSCGGVITTLMERSLIKIVGKAKVLGAPFLYGTTGEFLEYLGLYSLKDLPSMEELEQLLERGEAEEGGLDDVADADATTKSEAEGSGAGATDADPEHGVWPEDDVSTMGDDEPVGGQSEGEKDIDEVRFDGPASG